MFFINTKGLEPAFFEPGKQTDGIRHADQLHTLAPDTRLGQFACWVTNIALPGLQVTNPTLRLHPQYAAVQAVTGVNQKSFHTDRTLGDHRTDFRFFITLGLDIVTGAVSSTAYTAEERLRDTTYAEACPELRAKVVLPPKTPGEAFASIFNPHTELHAYAGSEPTNTRTLFKAILSSATPELVLPEWEAVIPAVNS